jgi:hypothetical protein
MALQVSQSGAGDPEPFCKAAEGDEVDPAAGGVLSNLREFVHERRGGEIGQR